MRGGFRVVGVSGHLQEWVMPERRGAARTWARGGGEVQALCGAQE